MKNQHCTFDAHTPLTPKQKKNAFFRSTWKTYSDNPEARQWLARLGKKSKRNRKIRKIISR